ncbi:MAG TPA: LysR family transcriptional regulator [Stenotrophomonas sp.]|nr:LysR family transcriptional regulator [Stenotrophomonas sp.]
MKALDIAAVQAFVLVADLQSFTRAADVLGTTQSSVSIKLGKLEKHLGRRLLERSPRHVRLSAEGQEFLAAARALVAAHDRAAGAFNAEQRKLVVGISHELVGSEVPALLRRINAHDPGLRLEMRVGSSRDLMALYEQGELDAAWVLRPEDRRKQGKRMYAEAFAWFGSIQELAPQTNPLPLATQGKGCRVRNAAVAALDQAGIAWEEVFVGKGAAIIGAAAAAGLAIAVLARRTAPAGTLDVSQRLSLPAIPTQDVMLYSSLNDRRSREALRVMGLAFAPPR